MISLPAGRPPRARADEIRALLSLREATLLAEVPEARVRKDIETGLIAPITAEGVDRLLFRWADVYLFAAVYKDNLLSSALRRKARDGFEDLVRPSLRRHVSSRKGVGKLMAAKCAWHEPGRLFASCDRLDLDGYLFINLAKVRNDVAPRVDLYAEGLSRMEEKEGVLGGDAVFRNTRLSVKHIGKMRDGGEAIESIREDYPYLQERDIAFAQLYHRAHPVVGRPSRHEEAALAGHPSSR